MQLTKVVLEGALGKRFGREWNLAVDTPGQALKLIDANSPGLFIWVRNNLTTYSHYQVVCEFEGGEMMEVDEDGLRHLPKRPIAIRFVPIVEGAGAAARIIAGAVIIALTWWNPGGWLGASAVAFGYGMGASLALGGVVSLLSPMPRANSADAQNERSDKTSFYFNGPVNTSEQGVPVALIYGEEVLVGSHPISVSVTVDQLM